MKLIITILIIAGAGIAFGWWNTQQVSDAGNQAVKVGADVAGVVGNAITEANKSSTPAP